MTITIPRVSVRSVSVFSWYDEDGNEIQGLQMVQADANGIWSCSWTGLDTDKTYTAKVRSIDGSSIEGDITEDTGLNADYDFGVMTIGANDSVIIMDSTLDATAEVKVEKIWVDGGFGKSPGQHHRSAVS